MFTYLYYAINNRVFTYKYADGSSFKNIINEYAKLSNMVCSDSNKITINILMSMYGMYNIIKDNKGGETLARN